MKVEIYPEDCLLQFTEKLLCGDRNPGFKGWNHLDKFPGEIEFSQEFLPAWRAIVEPAVKRFIATTFGIRGFLFDVNGYTRRFSAVDSEFWNDLEFVFSHRGAQRLYQYMLASANDNVRPLFHVATPADALLISICSNDFSRYSFPWLTKNSANWLIKAIFVTWIPARMAELPWHSLLLEPEKVELPLRDYLIEKAADYLAGCSFHTRSSTHKKPSGHPRFYRAENFGGQELKVDEYHRIIDTWIDYTNGVVRDVRAAIDKWTSTAVTNIDDEKFIAGAAKTYGFDYEVAEFENQAREYREGIGMEELIYESILSDQTSN